MFKGQLTVFATDPIYNNFSKVNFITTEMVLVLFRALLSYY